MPEFQTKIQQLKSQIVFFKSITHTFTTFQNPDSPGFIHQLSRVHNLFSSNINTGNFPVSFPAQTNSSRSPSQPQLSLFHFNSKLPIKTSTKKKKLKSQIPGLSTLNPPRPNQPTHMPAAKNTNQSTPFIFSNKIATTPD